MTDRHFAGQGKNLKVIGFTTMGKYRVTGEFNDQNLLERVVTWIPDRVMGDMQVEIRYSDYRDVGNGVKFPHRIHAHQGDHPLLPGGNGRNWMDVQVSNVQVNAAERGGRRFPAAVRNAPRSARARRRDTAQARRLADGRRLAQQRGDRVPRFHRRRRRPAGR